MQGEGTRTMFSLEGLTCKIDSSPQSPVGLLGLGMNRVVIADGLFLSPWKDERRHLLAVCLRFESALLLAFGGS